MLMAYVEGNDEKLIEALLEEKLNIDSSTFEIKKLGGGMSSLLQVPQQIRENMDNGDKVTVILDADSPPHAGFTNVCQALEDFKNDENLEFEYFLLPNHHDDGNLEDLLEQMINVNHQALFNCFDAYVNCLQVNNTGNFHLPVKKTKIYAYVDTLTPNNRKKYLKKGDYQFKDVHYWNLNSDSINGLVNFLENQIEDL
ncbi:DUF3226 domain-containing protein [Flagellimonas marina]|uniref:DUF3226 domain-containing protein n=1 Tax=Flagellimonas marina TaxID=1775168 RepID=A0ABV8PLW6_9FLAO